MMHRSSKAKTALDNIKTGKHLRKIGRDWNLNITKLTTEQAIERGEGKSKELRFFNTQKKYREKTKRQQDKVTIDLFYRPSDITQIFPSQETEKKIIIHGETLLGNKPNALIQRSYEEVLYLLFYRRLPRSKELLGFKKEISEHLNSDLLQQHRLLENNTELLEKDPYVLLEMMVLSLASSKITSRVEIFIKIFLLTVSLFCKRMNIVQKSASSDLSLVENLLYMTGKSETSPVLTKHFSRLLIAWIDFGLAPSSIAARINISSRADFIPSVVSGIINCTGTKHTSARIECTKFLVNTHQELIKQGVVFPLSQTIQNESYARKLLQNGIQERLDDGQLIYGFGHYVFKGNRLGSGVDPRIALVKEAIHDLYPQSHFLQMAEMMTNLFDQEGFCDNSGVRRYLPPNSDLYWSCFLLGFLEGHNFKDFKDIVSIFNILTRTAGIIAHCDEQLEENKAMIVHGWLGE